MIIRLCSKCNRQYDWERNSTECPHVGFPRSMKCHAHQRTNCGHEECRTLVIEMVHFQNTGITNAEQKAAS